MQRHCRCLVDIPAAKFIFPAIGCLVKVVAGRGRTRISGKMYRFLTRKIAHNHQNPTENTPNAPLQRVKNREIPPLFSMRFWSLIACRVGKKSLSIHYCTASMKWSKSTILPKISPKFRKIRKKPQILPVLSFLDR